MLEDKIKWQELKASGKRSISFQITVWGKDSVAVLFIAGLLYIHPCTTAAANNYYLPLILTHTIGK